MRKEKIVKTDDELKKDVMAELEWDPAVKSVSSIGVSVKDGVITLTGHLETFYEKYAATRAVQRWFDLAIDWQGSFVARARRRAWSGLVSARSAFGHQRIAGGLTSPFLQVNFALFLWSPS